MNLRELTTEHRKWLAHNFPNQTPDEAFLGVVEEVGEIAHTLLKAKQGIREHSIDTSQVFNDLVDGVGDLVIFLDGFCIGHNIDLSLAVADTWRMVKKRDWAAFPETGLPPPEENHVGVSD